MTDTSEHAAWVNAHSQHPHPSHLGFSHQPLPPVPDVGPDGFMDQSTEEVLLVSFRVTRYGKDDNEERAAVARRMLKELKLKHPHVEAGGMKLVERGGVKQPAPTPPPPKPEPRPSPSRTEM